METQKIVIVTYQPKEGKAEETRSFVASHASTLRNLGFITDRPGIIGQSENGSLIEVFEWKSEEHARLAHTHPEVAKIWENMAEVCTFTGFQSLPEVSQPFAHFTPLN